MSVLVIGQSGQIARALAKLHPVSSLDYCFMERSEADLRSPRLLEDAVFRVRPRIVINAAAYTAVDQAEVEPSIAYAVNAEGPRHLAVICRQAGIPLIQLSTDYVFDGAKGSPYAPHDFTRPVNVYGASKATGEAAVREVLREHVIIRLAWVYSETGRNFVTTMLDLADSRPDLRVVADQTGTPTYAFDAARAIDSITATLLSTASGWGTYHLTNAGQTNWYEFAETIFSITGPLMRRTPTLIPITTREFAAPARRPPYTVLDTTLTSQRFIVSMPHWQDGLERCLASLWADNTTTIRDHMK